MLAVVKEHTGPGFAIKDVPMPVCREDDVIVKVKSVGFCGSDGPILAGTREVPYPRTRIRGRYRGNRDKGKGLEGGRPCQRMHRDRLR